MTDNKVQPFTKVNVDNSDEVKHVHGSIITFKSINYYLKTQNRCNMCQLPCLKKTPKRILTDLTGIFKPGMNAIMGPTGSGKSSLLDVLADRKNRQGLEGEILLNGQLQGKDFKYRVGYVVQDDIVSGSLTVRENLMFSANVRLPTKLSSKVKMEIVNEALMQLNLEKCADTMVGTDFKRGVSGGERKRTNIGMELILSPTVLFLDEPTTGLDSSTASNVMECLHRLSEKGHTIVFSIHQPRYSIFKLFDTLFLIAAGLCVYHGPASDVLQFFSSVGFQCEEHNNPADFILDVSQDGRLPSLNNQDDRIDSDNPQDKIECFLNDAYTKTTIYNSIQNQIYEKNNLSNENIIEPIRSLTKSRLNDILYVCQRTLRNSFRDPSLAILQTVMALALAIITGFIFLNLNYTIETGVKNRNGAIFFIVTNQVFVEFSALDIFIKERILFMHENVSGYYHVFTYFLSKILCDILLLRTILAIGSSLIMYFMVEFQRTAEKFFVFFFCIWLTSICSSSLCLFISASVHNSGIANLLASLFSVITLAFSGYLIELSSVGGFLRWIQYISIFRYPSNILSINEYNGLTLCLSSNTSICSTNSSGILNDLNIEYSSNWDLWENFVALALITIVFLTLTYIRLRCLKKTK